MTESLIKIDLGVSKINQSIAQLEALLKQLPESGIESIRNTLLSEISDLGLDILLGEAVATTCANGVVTYVIPVSFGIGFEKLMTTLGARNA